MKRFLLFIFTITSILLLHSCIVICIETKASIRKSYKFKNQIGLTVEELKATLINDTTNYKIVIIYSPLLWSLCTPPSDNL